MSPPPSAPGPTQDGLLFPISAVFGSAASLNSASRGPFTGRGDAANGTQEGSLSLWTRLRLSSELLTLWTQQA